LDTQKSTLRVETVALDQLFENPANPRLNDAAVPHVAASLRRFGWQQPHRGEALGGDRGGAHAAPGGP
jgi:hypothetical protein